MSPKITAYLAASHIAVVATINRHGHPHLTPNWYRYDGKVLPLITRKDRLKYLNLQTGLLPFSPVGEYPTQKRAMFHL